MLRPRSKTGLLGRSAARRPVLPARSSPAPVTRIKVRDHLAGRPELLDNGKASRLLDQQPLAVQMHVIGPDDQPNRDATNKLVLVT
jgi:hypothetical protein